MNSEKRVFVFQSYGPDEIQVQVKASVLSLLSLEQKVPFQILLYTDREEAIAPFYRNLILEGRILLQRISAEQIQHWRGPTQFVHRVKLEIILDSLKKDISKFIYLDGDTFFLKSADVLWDRIQDGTSVLHTRENIISQGKDLLSKKMTKFLKRNRFESFGRLLSPEFEMWNAGVIGLSQEQFYLMEPILHLSDSLHTQYQKHVMEQLAVSFVLQIQTRLQAVDDVIYHYWDGKDEVLKKIIPFFEKHQDAYEALKDWKSLQETLLPQLVKSRGDRNYLKSLNPLARFLKKKFPSAPDLVR